MRGSALICSQIRLRQFVVVIVVIVGCVDVDILEVFLHVASYCRRALPNSVRKQGTTMVFSVQIIKQN